MVEVFDDNSVSSFLFELVCVVVDVVFFEIPNEGSVRFWCYAVYFDYMFDKLFVEYCSSSAMFLIWLIIAP